MRKTGGTLAIIGGAFSLFAVGHDLGIQSFGRQTGANPPNEMTVPMMWAGAMFASLTIVLGATMRLFDRRVVANSVILCAIAGTIAGVIGSAGAVPGMVIAAFGGVMGLLFGYPKRRSKA